MDGAFGEKGNLGESTEQALANFASTQLGCSCLTSECSSRPETEVIVFAWSAADEWEDEARSSRAKVSV